MKTNCVFCRIIQGVQKAKRVYEDEDALVIEDIYPRGLFIIWSSPRNIMIACLKWTILLC